MNTKTILATPVKELSREELEVAYLMMMNGSRTLQFSLETFLAKQIANVLQPYASAFAEEVLSDNELKNVYPISDFRKEENIKKLFDDSFCKEVASFIREQI